MEIEVSGLVSDPGLSRLPKAQGSCLCQGNVYKLCPVLGHLPLSAVGHIAKLKAEE